MGKPHFKRQKTGRKRAREMALISDVPADQAWNSGYDGANASMNRGYIVWPTNDTRLELDSFSRYELQRRIRYLFANAGFLRGFVRNSATLVGWVKPQARSGKREWNRKQEMLFRKRTKLAVNFDRAGKFNFRKAQLMIQRRKRVDGDILTVLTTNDERTAPAVAFYEAHQLANPKDGGDAWRDGVKIGQGGRHLAYGLKGDDGKVTVVPASSVIYFGAFDSPGHPRAISPFAHAVNHSTDITEIRADTKKNIKAAAQVGLAAYTEAGAPQTKAKDGMPGVLAKQRVQVSDGAGGTTEGQMETRRIYSGSTIADLPPGKRLEVLHDARPSPNQMAFSDELIRDIAVGFGLPPEIIWKMINLTGPGVRFVMDYASRWIEEEQDELAEWAERVWLYFTAWEIAHGHLELPGGDADWMEVEFLPQRDLTIDRGKEGKLDLEILDRGLGTEADFHRKMSGKDFEEQTTRHIEEVSFKLKECERLGVDFEKAYPPRAGAAPVEPANGGKGEKEETEEEDES